MSPQFANGEPNIQARGLTEALSQPGIASELCTLLETLDYGPPYANYYGWIALSGMDGQVCIQHSELPAQRASQQTTAAARGPRKWFGLGKKTRPQRTANPHVDCYHLQFLDEYQHTVHLRTQVDPTNGYIYVNGHRVVTQEIPNQTGQLETVEVSEDIVVIDALKRALQLVANGVPVPMDLRIILQQDNACELIVGPEATGIQRMLEPLIRPLLKDAGKPDQFVQKFVPIRPRLDGQWSIADVVIIKGSTSGYIDPDQQYTTAFINFSDKTVNAVGSGNLEGPLVVRVEGVYERHTDRLLWTKVFYYYTTDTGNQISLAVAPQYRQEIQQALQNQLKPQNLMLQKPPKPELA